ncbi:MAG: C4-type zinc ribbon domain-containing protein [Spirochaetota bacterium]
MNKDIKTMIDLQRYMDNILRGKNGIEKNEKSILYWKKEQEEKKKEILILEENIKELKITIKQKEIDLSEKEEQLKKLEKRKDIVKNEKEMTALEHEYSKVKADKDILENDTLEMMDFIEQKQSKCDLLDSDLNNFTKQFTLDIRNLEEKIEDLKKIITENQQNFDGCTDQLSPSVKAKFLKLIKSQNGKAISSIEGENCSICNFQVPFNVIQDLSKENMIVNCTNCGRFLYKE